MRYRLAESGYRMMRRDTRGMKRIPRYLAAHEAGHAVAAIMLGPRAIEPRAFEFVGVGEPASPDPIGNGFLRWGDSPLGFQQN
jgi:hypothetical protein